MSLSRHALTITATIFASIGIAQATPIGTNLITNGSFESPSVGNGYSLFSNGKVPGWTSNNNEIEIDDSTILGGPAYDGSQSAELNGTTFDTISQTVAGLTPGDLYRLSWAYGSRPGFGPQQTVVSFGGQTITTDSSTGDSASSLDWVLNSFTVSATASSETVSFAAKGMPGYNRHGGNELDAVSLFAVPEPGSLALLGTGLIGLGLVSRGRGRRRNRGVAR